MMLSSLLRVNLFLALTTGSTLLTSACVTPASACEVSNKNYRGYDGMLITKENVQAVEAKDYLLALEILGDSSLIKIDYTLAGQIQINLPETNNAYLVKACFLGGDVSLDSTAYKTLVTQDFIRAAYIPELQLILLQQERFWMEGLHRVPVPIIVSLDKPIDEVDSISLLAD